MSKQKIEVASRPVARVTFATPYTYHEEVGEENSGEVQTVPDMAMSIPEIMMRFTSGRPVPQSSRLVYTQDEFLPDVRTLDLVDHHEMLEAAKERAQKLQKEVEEKRQVRRERIQQKRDKLKTLLETEIQDVKPEEIKDMSNKGGAQQS